ncbi:MAG: DUF4350 domain-containing protein [Promethearchaeota archaeon]
MTRFKHVLILVILILPMFALAPSLVASPNVTLASQEKVDSSLPAQFVEETLRVAVYAESNLTLPAYATGGVYTDYYQNVIDLLNSAGYAVTVLSTQDILNHRLMVADYDAFVLPNQLPRESIINQIKDYWLGGGGVLSFGASAGFLFYSGLIDPSLEGQFSLYPIDAGGLWTYAGLTGHELYDGIYLNQRNPVTKSLEEGTVYPFTGNETLLGGFSLPGLLGTRYLELAYQDGQPTYTSIAGFDNPDRGGKIVFLPGNCSSFETWIRPVIVDAVDWLAPRLKGRILYDLSHMPEVTPDPWDPWIENYFLTNWRDGLVNRSYIVDKLYPSSQGNLTSDNLDGYDMLVVLMPNLNFTAQEVNDVRDWVAGGGSLLTVGDEYSTFAHMMQNLNYLLSWSDIRHNPTLGGGFDVVASVVGEHPIHEAAPNLNLGGFSYINVTGNAYAIYTDGIGDVVAGEEYGNGRVIACPDGNFFTDELGIFDLDNFQFHMNVANWLTAATAKVLLYNDEFHSSDMYGVAPVVALESLGIDFYLTNSEAYFNLSLYEYWDQWDLVIFDQPGTISDEYLDDFQAWIESGGKMISSVYWIHGDSEHPLWPLLGFIPVSGVPDQPDVYIWESANPIFNLPVEYGADRFIPIEDYGGEGSSLHMLSNGIALAGLTASSEENQSVIALRDDGKVLTNAFLIDEFQGDHDNSTYTDSVELWVNEIGYIYYNRPTIDNPADVTYMETETGNEITWTPTADAGPRNYVFRVNGTLVESGPWTGAPLTFNVDGVNVSITEYQLTVFDRLGYSVSDIVTLNVTEYVAPTPPPFGIDPLLLLVIGGAIAGVVIILIVITQMKKKK